VTQSAGHIRVPIGEQESRRAVVECCCRPTHRRVAGRAIHKRKRRPGCWMDRVLGLLPGRQMASRIAAIGRGDHQIIVIVNMTKGAGHIRMAIGQQETGRAVVELGVQPTVERMAGIAGCRELCGNVIGIGGFLKIRQVAGRAGGRKTQVIADGSVLMALLALQDGMRAEEREPVEVLLNRLDRYLPAENRVAPGAVLAELGAVNVGVTIGAVLANIGENRLGVASRAGYLFVHAAKRIPRGVVAKFGNRADRGPAGVRVAIFAGDRQWTVRTPSRLPLCGCRADNRECQKGEDYKPTDLKCSVNDCPQML